MPRHEPARRAVPAGPPAKVRMRLRPDGSFEPIVPDEEKVATTEAAERPPTPDDPRTANQRAIPPYGAGI